MYISDISISTGKWRLEKGDFLFVFVTQENLKTQVAQIDSALSGALGRLIKEDDYKGKKNKFLTLTTHQKLAVNTVVLVGLGKTNRITKTIVREAAASAISKFVQSKKSKALFLLDASGLEITAFTKSVVEGVGLGSYSYDTYKSKKDNRSKSKVVFLSAENRVKAVKKGLSKGHVVTEAVVLARNLVNEPPTVMTPTYLAREANKIAKQTGVTVQVLEKKQIEKLGMHSYLAVSRGSHEEPKFIMLVYDGGGDRTVVLAGKAITFDTGGLSLKPAQAMETMKLDMAGGAAVLGVFKALSKLKPKVKVIGLIAASDNMPGPKAIKPGDVVRAMNGKTIEILNTDAEGRLTLADVLSYASEKIKPDYIIDLATLTGAALVALGEDIAALFASDDDFKKDILKAASESGEKMWELPLEKSYKDLIKSHIADVRNIGKSRYGGTITAALFLQEFVDKKIPWIHLDIAGPAYAEKGNSLTPKGGSGFGVRTLLEWLGKFK